MIETIQRLSKEYLTDITEIRRHLHTHPELSFAENATSAYIRQQLKIWNIPYKEGYAGTGITAFIHGNNPHSALAALRADMDALPIQEENEVAYKSVVPGVMHACGHDVHTACLLGSARILNAIKSSFKGTVQLIFQPGEEVLPGGASLMIRDGVFEEKIPSCIFGQHVYPELPAGKIGLKSGWYMASADEIYITVKGKGGHGARPNDVIDPVQITAQLLVALQQVVSRWAHPGTPSVLSFGKVIANGATNIIPNEVILEGTFRTFDEKWRSEAHDRMKKLTIQLTSSLGGSCDFRIEKGYPALFNHEELTSNAKKKAIEYLGEKNVVELGLRMTSEDFSYYGKQMPCCFYRLGTAGKNGEKSSGVHTSTFDIDERAIETGMGLMTWLALSELEK
ncbi:MAG: amidohydrolase [Crocinitomicaceae bacterium]|nr:amidohydrolase [Crocinitomicaceae bacterium]